jgi:hypothetical protein
VILKIYLSNRSFVPSGIIAKKERKCMLWLKKKRKKRKISFTKVRL